MVICSGNKFNGSDIKVLRRTMTQPFDVVMVHPTRQPRGEILTIFIFITALFYEILKKWHKMKNIT